MTKIKDYFKLPRMFTSNKHDADVIKPGVNKYMPHQGKQEKARRVRQMERHNE